MMHFFVTPSGKVRFLYNEKLGLESAGASKIERFASVEPSSKDPSQWEVSILGDGQVLKDKMFPKRSEALKAEEREVVRRLRHEQF